ncbi:MAG TPA: hypothetical protein VK426_02110 [Methanobacterium sp.]|nr:hypothetical protein [Methanobacterium sp.]
MIKSKTLAIVLAILTFIFGSIILTVVACFIAKIPITSIWEGQNQFILFSAVLISAVLASMVYGRGSKQKADDAAEFLNEKLDLGIQSKTIGKFLRLLENFPPFVVNSYISKDINAVKEFESAIMENTKQLTDEDLLKVKKIINMPVGELQKILSELYLITNMEQLKILAEPRAGPLIELNLNELRKILFGSKKEI